MVKNIYLTVHEFASLHHVNKRTLHYYDSIGIFHPQKVGENGYRYYTYMQSAEFEIILALRELGMSIEEIREYQKNRSAEALSSLFLEKTQEIDSRISQLKDLKKILCTKRENMLLAQSEEIRKIHVVRCKPEYLFLTDLSGYRSAEDVDENLYASLAGYQQEGDSVRAFNSSYGSMLPVERLMEGQFERSRYLFVTIPKPRSKKDLFLKPGGSYLRAYGKAEWETTADTYRRILQYAEENHLKLLDYAYEEGINELGIPSMEAMGEYVTQISVRCEPAE